MTLEILGAAPGIEAMITATYARRPEKPPRPTKSPDSITFYTRSADCRGRHRHVHEHALAVDDERKPVRTEVRRRRVPHELSGLLDQRAAHREIAQGVVRHEIAGLDGRREAEFNPVHRRDGDFPHDARITLDLGHGR